MGLTWSDGFATGVAEIDAQHKELIIQVDRLLGALASDPSAVGRLLDFLGDYAVSHFDTEERMMEAAAYPGAERHREAHAGFVRAFGRLRFDYDLDGLTEGMSELIGGWMIQWLTSHILDLDKQLARWLLERGAADVVLQARGGTWVVPSGALLRVLSVTPGRGLHRAGVAAGDLVVALGGKRVAELGLQKAIAALASPGPSGLTLTLHPGGDRGRIETRFLAKQVAAAAGRG